MSSEYEERSVDDVMDSLNDCLDRTEEKMKESLDLIDIREMNEDEE